MPCSRTSSSGLKGSFAVLASGCGIGSSSTRLNSPDAFNKGAPARAPTPFLKMQQDSGNAKPVEGATSPQSFATFIDKDDVDEDWDLELEQEQQKAQPAAKPVETPAPVVTNPPPAKEKEKEKSVPPADGDKSDSEDNWDDLYEVEAKIRAQKFVTLKPSHWTEASLSFSTFVCGRASRVFIHQGLFLFVGTGRHPTG